MNQLLLALISASPPVQTNNLLILFQQFFQYSRVIDKLRKSDEEKNCSQGDWVTEANYLNSCLATQFVAKVCV